MVDAVSSVAPAVVNPVRTSVERAPADASQDAAAVSASSGSVVVSPAIKTDPVVGVILEFNEKNGQPPVQIPSEAAVAYAKLSKLQEDGTTDHSVQQRA